jgi:M6 family metalloprotease-like protein
MITTRIVLRTVTLALAATALILGHARDQAFAQGNALGSLSVVAPLEAAPVEARLHVWTPVPGLSTGVASLEGDNLEITVSAEMYQPGGGVWFRAVVDGKVAQPSDVLFKSGSVNFDGVRSFTFVQPYVGVGQHLVEIQWRTGSKAFIRDRTLTVHSGSPSMGRNRLAVAAAPSGPDLVKSTVSYEDIPGLATSITTETPNTLAVVFSAEGGADSGRMLVRALVDGAQVGEVIFSEAGDPGRGGTRSFTFTQLVLAPGTHEIRLQWRADGGVSRIGDRTIVVSAVHSSSQQAITSAPQNPMNLQLTGWTDMPPGSNLFAGDPVTNVAVSFSGEVLSNQGRLFLRVLVDDQPASPGDVTLIQGGSKWRATSHTFVLKNVSGGPHRIRVQAKVDPQTTARLRKTSIRVLWKRRSGSDFVQPYLGMAPLTRTFPLLVICFDPLRPLHQRPTFAQIRAIFEGNPTGPGPINAGVAALVRPPVPEAGPNVHDWLAENSGGVATLRDVRYAGCADGQWYVAPPEHQGDWYWMNGEFEQMWKDALHAADNDVDFHAYDTDQNNILTTDELLVAIVRPQATPDGTVRGTATTVDGNATPLSFTITDLYLSSNAAHFLTDVGVTAHELSHQVFKALDLYGVCPEVSSEYYSIMDYHWRATHLDPFEKMKNGLVQPMAVDLSQQGTATLALPAVESRYQILLLYHPDRVGREYFLIENRFPGTAAARNYDGPLQFGAVVVWQIFEDRNLTENSAVCPGDVRFIRRRRVLLQPGQSIDLAWSDGTPAGFRVTAPMPNAELAQVSLQKL